MCIYHTKKELPKYMHSLQGHKGESMHGYIRDGQGREAKEAKRMRS